jgi:myo-inositol-1(or 4)-monophosphatase
MPETASSLDLDALLDVARRAAHAGACAALRWAASRGQLRVQEKAGSSDLVSQADRDAEGAIRTVLFGLRPDDAVLGEEGGTSPGTSSVRWAIDPIDGTIEYLYDRPNWAVSVAAISALDGTILAGVVAEPALSRTTAARLGGGAWCAGRRLECRKSFDLSRALVEINLGAGYQRTRAADVIEMLVPRVRDIRDCGSAASALAAVAAGRIDGYWGPGLNVWDAAAGILLVSEAGGTIGDLAGPCPPTWPASGDVLAANAGLHEQLRRLLRPIWREPLKLGAA